MYKYVYVCIVCGGSVLVMFMAASVLVGVERWSLVWAVVCPGRPHQGLEAAAGQTSAAYARQHKGGALGFSHPSVARCWQDCLARPCRFCTLKHPAPWKLFEQPCMGNQENFFTTISECRTFYKNRTQVRSGAANQLPTSKPAHNDRLAWCL
jgi:hypothetical protein